MKFQSAPGPDNLPPPPEGPSKGWVAWANYMEKTKMKWVLLASALALSGCNWEACTSGHIEKHELQGVVYSVDPVTGKYAVKELVPYETADFVCDSTDSVPR